MLCPKCGKLLRDGMPFCASCGLLREPDAAQPAAARPRSDLDAPDNAWMLGLLNGIYSYFLKIEPLVKEYEKYSMKKKDMEKSSDTAKHASKFYLQVGLITITVCSLLAVFAGWIPMFGRFFRALFSLNAIIAGSGMIIISVNQKKQAGQYQEKAESYHPLIEAAKAKCIACDEEMRAEMRFWIKRSPADQLLDTREITYLIKALRTGRAKNVEHALRLWDERRHGEATEGAAFQ